MKRLSLLALAALFVTSSVFAQDAPKAEGQFKFNGAAYAYRAMYQLSQKMKVQITVLTASDRISATILKMLLQL